ncbi:MAG: hypothetical protein AB1564_15635 [Chloroflexota bacterium]
MDYDNELFKQAYINWKAGEISLARRYTERALELADDNETRLRATFLMSRLISDADEKRKLLETVLAYEPTHPEARRELAILDGRLKPEDIIDPNNLPLQATAHRKASADRFTCPSCGGRMVFAPDGQSLICEFCANHQNLKNGKTAAEQDFILTMATAKGHRKPVAMQVLHCSGCGAEYVLGPQTLSLTCAFCGSNLVVKVAETRQLVPPGAVLPFALDEEAAARRFDEWTRKLRFRSTETTGKPRGLYFPAWTFDIFGQVPWKAVVVKGRNQYETVEGMGAAAYNDLLVPAARNRSPLLDALLPTFDLSEAKAYDPRYLASFPAKLYDIAMSDASLDARAEAARRAPRDVREQMGLDPFLSVENVSVSSAQLSVVSFKLLLVPLWIGGARRDDKEYSLLINGQNGKAVSETDSEPRNWLSQ